MKNRRNIPGLDVEENMAKFEALDSRLEEMAEKQAEQELKQDRNYIDIWEPKKMKDKVASFFQNTFEMWVVMWVSAISYMSSSLVSTLFVITFSLLFLGMIQT
jgi:hypothetical protein